MLVICVFSGVKAQTFTIVSDRIEYIDPETHKLMTITENIEDFKSVKLSRIDIFNYYINHELSFSIEDLYDDRGEPSGTAVSLMIPLDFKSREK